MMVSKFNFKGNFYKMILFLLFFFLIYPNKLKGMPSGTREIFALIGGSLFITDKIFEIERIRNCYFSKNLIQVFAALFFIACTALISIAFNQTRDIEYIRYFIVVSTIIFGGYLLYYFLSKVYLSLTFQTIGHYIVLIVFIQCIISLLMFVIPSVGSFFLSIQDFSTLDVEKIEETVEFRLLGFGTNFFGAGVVNSYALILISFLIPIAKKKRSLFFFASAFLLISIIGMMMSRTTAVGIILGMVVLFFPNKEKDSGIKKRNFSYYLLYNMIILGSVFYSILLLFPKVLSTVQVAWEFGFELIINYFEHGQVESPSTNRLQEMYVFPQNISTYIFGDGRFYEILGNPSGGYYMETDVGYLRLIYYFGIVGCILFYWLQFLPIKQIGQCFLNKNDRYKFIIVMFTFVLIVGFKGLADLLFLNLLWGTLWIRKSEDKVQ